MINKTVKIIASIIFAVILTCLVMPEKAQAMTGEQQYLINQMQAQYDVISAANQYFDYQDAVAKADGRKISDIEMVKRQALQGVVSGDYWLLDNGYRALATGVPAAAASIADVDKAAYEGMIAGLKELENIKQKTWMTYTWRTH